MKILACCSVSVFVVCKQGNESQKAVLMMKKYVEEQFSNFKEKIKIKDLIGGLTAWSSQIDRTFPTY